MLPLTLTLAFPLLLLVGYSLLFVLGGRDPRLVVGPVGFVLYLALLAIPFIAIMAAEPDLLARALAWRVDTAGWLVAGLAGGAALWWLQLALPGRTPDAGQRVWTGPSGRRGFALLLLPVATIVLAEEVVWRAFLQRQIGLGLSAAAFALHHYFFGLRHIAFSFLAGLAWGGLYLLAESLWPAVASHLLYNALAWRHLRRDRPPAPSRGANPASHSTSS